MPTLRARLTALDPAAWAPRRPLLALALPGLFAAFFLVIGPLWPTGHVVGYVLHALSLAAPRWCVWLWPLWSVGLALRVPALAPGALVGALLGVALAGDPGADPDPGRGWRVVSSNVNAYSPEGPEGVSEALGALAADVVLIIEKRPEEIPGMRRAADNFAVEVPRPSHHTAAFCRDGLACEAVITEEFGSETSKMPLALVRLPDGICLFGIHSPPPAPYDPSGLLPYLQRVAAALSGGRVAADWGPCRAGDPAVVAGDLNTIPRSEAYRTLLRGTGLRDALASRGVYAASWPSGGGWPDIPFFQLDHLLPGDVDVWAERVRRVPGADHKALVFRVARR